jgi:putative redox protein
MTLKMYASRKAMSLENAIVIVDIERTDDVEKFTRDIQLIGHLSAEEKSA